MIEGYLKVLVTRILIEGGKAVGVELKQGGEVMIKNINDDRGDGDGDCGNHGDHGYDSNNQNYFMIIAFPMIDIEAHKVGCEI